MPADFPFRDLTNALESAPGVPPWKQRGKDPGTGAAYGLLRVVVHHSATASHTTPEELHRYHIDKNWGTEAEPARAPRVTYHYLVNANGVQWKCNRSTDITWHCKGHNTESLGVCLIGNFQTHEVPLEQWLSAVHLVARLCRAYKLRVDYVRGHRELFATACPGKYLDIVRFRTDVAFTTPAPR